MLLLSSDLGCLPVFVGNRGSATSESSESSSTTSESTTASSTTSSFLLALFSIFIVFFSIFVFRGSFLLLAFVVATPGKTSRAAASSSDSAIIGVGHFAILLFLLVSGGNLGGGFGGRRVILAGQVLIGNGTIAHIVMLFKRITCGGDDWLVECEGGCNIIIYYITKRKKKVGGRVSVPEKLDSNSIQID